MIAKLNQPEQCLLAYGTLGPGKPNHHKLEHIEGVWMKGFVRGKLEQEGWAARLGYPGFRLAEP